MNGAQDLGGAMGFGPVVPEPDEPVFHAEWERRAFAITVAAGFTAQWNIDMARSARESMPPAQYLASSYYQIWLSGLERLLVARGMLGDQELAAALSGQKPTTVLRNEKAAGRCVGLAKLPAVLAAGGPTERPAPQPARFSVGDAVRTVVIHPKNRVSRLVSLAPPVHIAVIQKGQVLESLDELFAMERHDFLKDDLAGSMNLISGPSKTADIEGTTVTGIHGPLEVHLLILE